MLKRKFKQTLFLALISSVMITFIILMMRSINSSQNAVLFGYSRHAREINVMFGPTADVDMEKIGESIKKILDEENANLFTYPDKGIGMYINDDFFIEKKEDKELLSQLKENEIMVLQDSIMDTFSNDLIADHSEIKLTGLNFRDPQLIFSDDFIFAIDSVEYVYNFFDFPYFNGYFIIDSKTNPNAPYEVVRYLNQQGYNAYVVEGSLNYQDDLAEAVISAYTSNVIFMIIPALFLLYIINTVIVADYILKEENSGVEIRGYYGASFLEQFFNIMKSISLPLLISSLIWGGIIYNLNFSISSVLLTLLINTIYMFLIFFITFTFQYVSSKLKNQKEGV